MTSSFYAVEGFAYNSLLQENAINLLSPGGTASISAPDPTTGNFSIYAAFILVPSVSIPKGATFSVDSQLTLVSDPGSLIQLSGFATLPPGTEIPTIGAFAGGPIPEPSAWIQFGSAMALLLAFWGRARRRKFVVRSPRMPGVPLAFLAGLTCLIMGLGTGAAEAGSVITVNDIAAPVSASSAGFSSTSLGIDTVKETATFDGTYLSALGAPAPGVSVTYSVIFLEPDGTQSDAAELMISGLTPTATENTSVHLFFQGVVTTPVAPGPGIYFIPEPSGYFDIAAYLNGQGLRMSRRPFRPDCVQRECSRAGLSRDGSDRDDCRVPGRGPASAQGLSLYLPDRSQVRIRGTAAIRPRIQKRAVTIAAPGRAQHGSSAFLLAVNAHDLDRAKRRWVEEGRCRSLAYPPAPGTRFASLRILKVF